MTHKKFLPLFFLGLLFACTSLDEKTQQTSTIDSPV